MFESSLQLAADEEFLRESTQPAKAHIVINYVTNYRPRHAVSHLRDKFVTVMETLEWPLLLNVREMMIPLKLGDQCDPLRAKGKEGNDAE